MSDYEGVTVAGLAIVAEDTGNVFLAQRAPDETDAPEVAETWEFPGGHLSGDEDPQTAAFREFREEIGLEVPDGEVVDGWRSDDGHYQGFVYRVPEEFALDFFTPNDEVQSVGWMDRETIGMIPDLRPEVAKTDWDLIFGVSGNSSDEGESMDDEFEAMTEDETDYSEVFAMPIPIHGVIAPEEVPTGDRRGFEAGSMTQRPGRLPFRWAETDTGEHNGARAVGSVDRMMRKDNLIHFEGQLMPSRKGDEFAGLMEFFDGRYGVSVDGDNGSLNPERTKTEGIAWFDAVRTAGLTAVDIPAFAEAYVAFGPHPEMPREAEAEAMVASGDLVKFDRGPGWVTNPDDTRRIHRYWTEKGQPGYEKIGWGTPGDFRRAKALIGEKILKNSPEKARFLNQIIAQWHFDALGYWPGDLGKPGNAPDTPENRKRAATHASLEEEATFEDDEWQVVLTAAGRRVLPPLDYFHRHPDTGALVITEPDANGIRRTYGYAAQWGVCHIGFDGTCVEPPETMSNEYPDFHLGRTKTKEGYIYTGLLTYGKKHRSAGEILSETPTQAHFDDVSHAWAAVRVGEDDTGIWFSGVVLPTVEEKWITAIEASGQVSGEWKRGTMRALLTVNIPGFPVERPTAEFDSDGNVLALAASAFGQVADAPCAPTPEERMAALRAVSEEVTASIRMAALRAAQGEKR